jgi:hypothetical protein
MAKKQVFKDRYVLGSGYPWAFGVESKMVGVNEAGTGMKTKSLKFPKTLWSKDIPKYRIVLERVK